MLFDILSLKSCIIFSDNQKVHAILCHCDIPAGAHQKSCSCLAHKLLFHENYFLFLFFFTSERSLKHPKAGKTSLFQTVIQMSLQHLMRVMIIVLSMVSRVTQLQYSSCLRHLQHEIVTQWIPNCGASSKKLHPLWEYNFPQRKFPTFFSKCRYWTHSQSLHIEAFEFWFFSIRRLKSVCKETISHPIFLCNWR